MKIFKLFWLAKLVINNPQKSRFPHINFLVYFIFYTNKDIIY